MGLFSNLRKATNGASTAETTAKAVLSMPLMVAAADGQIDDAEVHQILNMCAFSPIFHAVGAERTHQLAQEAVNILKTKGAEALFMEVKGSLSPNLVETAMCFAIRTSLADGHLDDREKDMLIAMGQRLDLPQETFMKIFEVMMMLQRPAS